MEQVEGAMVRGERDYQHINGTTGPLVYPAGHIYSFYAIWKLTKREVVDETVPSGTFTYYLRDVQAVFFPIYLLFGIAVLLCYSSDKSIPPWLVLATLTSPRIHNIFLLGFFNDCICMLFFYLSCYCFLRQHWTWGCIYYSLSVSVKMNALLASPGLLLLLLINTGFVGTFYHLTTCASVQLALGAPFLLVNPLSYIARSFNLGRQFDVEQSVNFAFLNNSLFISSAFSILLLLATVSAWVLFLMKFKKEGLLSFHRSSPHEILLVLFLSNFVGVCFSRTLHYQFLVWYAHMLPYLAWQLTSVWWPFRMLLCVSIYLAWEVFPATFLSSLALQVTQLVLLYLLFVTPKLFSNEVNDRKQN